VVLRQICWDVGCGHGEHNSQCVYPSHLTFDAHIRCQLSRTASQYGVWAALPLVVDGQFGHFL
jgi:hypothetical protein